MFRKLKTEIYHTSMYKMQKMLCYQTTHLVKIFVFMCALIRIRWISQPPPDFAPGYVDRDLLHLSYALWLAFNLTILKT